MDYKKSCWLTKICSFTGIILIILGIFIRKISIIGWIIFISGILQSLIWCRCPHCRKYIDINLYKAPPKHCSNCGEKLFDE